jgi:D-alanyl-D-alanine carboxypeptidase
MPSTSVSVTPGTTTVTKAEPAPVRTTVPFSVKVASADSLQGPAGADETIFPVANSSGKGDNLLQPDPATTDSKSALKKPVMASLAGASAAAAAEAETISPASDPAPEAAQDVAPARKSVANSGWNIQIGASPSEDGANSLISKAKKLRIAALSGKPSFMLEAARGKERIYRARFSGFTEKTARAACRQLSRKGLDCLAVQPET